MFIVLGVLTFLWGFFIWFLLPDSISKAKFLSEEERQFATNRILVAGTGTTEQTAWKWDQALECVMDPKTWLIFGLELLTQIPNGGTQNFANLVVVSFGFTSLQSTLINIPYSLITVATIAGSGWLAGRFRQANCLLITPSFYPVSLAAQSSTVELISSWEFSCLDTSCFLQDPLQCPLPCLLCRLTIAV